MYTLNNIVSLFEAFAINHYSLQGSEHFYFGVAGEHESKNGGIKYPLMVAEPISSNVAIKQDSYDFKMYFMSQHKLYEGRDVEMLSDLKQIATDFIIWLRQTKYSDNKTFTIDENITLTDFHHSFNDDSCGWYFTLRCKQFLDWDKCGIPMIGYTPPTNVNVVNILDQDNNIIASLTVGQTYTVTQLTTLLQDLSTTPPTTIIQDLT